MVILKTTYGNINIELDFKNTPITAKNFLQYAKAGFYKDTLFHRVINNFMIQGGGFDKQMQKKQTASAIKNEAYLGNHNAQYTVAMARTSNPHSASSQFFINVVDNDFLDFKNETVQGWGYCVFGKVVEGRDIVDQIQKVPTATSHGHQDVPIKPVIILDVLFDEK